MITTRMSVKEVFKEFEKDKDLVYSRFNGFVHANKKSLLRIQKQKGKDFWIPCKGVRHPIINYNKYRGCIKVNFITPEKFNISSVTYLILNDSITGGRIVYLMPAEKSDTWLITMTPKFFEEFNQKQGYSPESFTESVDNFMKLSGSYEVYENQESGDPRYNYINTLEEINAREGYSFIIICITDIIKNGSYIIYTKEAEIVLENIYGEIKQGYYVDGLVSRKKQILPAVLENID